jgi:ectoine hydroxylase-related dioxygenase (phytanoyl-CoA dioxygenase family)
MPSCCPDDFPQASRDGARLTADLDRFGYCIIEDALPAKTVAEIHVRLENQAAAETAQGHRKLDDLQSFGDGNQWVYMLINKGRVFRELMRQTIARDTVAHVLGTHYLLSNFAATITHPDNNQMGLHIDQWWLPVPRPSGEERVRTGDLTRSNIKTGVPERAESPINPPVVCNVLWMISDFTIENGATRVVPFSHLSGRQPDPSAPQETINVTGKAGTALVLEGRTWHAADINRSTAPRYGITTFYCGPQFRQMDNYTYGTKHEVIAELEPDLKQLLGFSPWGGYGATGEPRADIRPGAETPGELNP